MEYESFLSDTIKLVFATKNSKLFASSTLYANVLTPSTQESVYAKTLLHLGA